MNAVDDCKLEQCGLQIQNRMAGANAEIAPRADGAVAVCAGR